MIPFERRYCATILVLSCIATAGCKEKDSGAPSAVPVTVATVERRPVPFSLDAAGTVEPLQRVNVEGQVSGQLMRIGFHEGDQVTKGQVLFEIDSRPFKAALDATEAMLARDVAQAQNAQRDVERYAALVQKEYVTTQQYDATKAQAAALNATVMADSAAVMTARLNLQYATVRAPISGLAGSLQIREGNLVRGPGTTLVTINQIRPILVRFPLPAQQLGEIRRRPMKDVEVLAQPAGTGVPVKGRLVFLDNAVDSSTGTILLKGSFDNTDGTLWPGQFVSVSVQLYVQQDALAIPAVAVLTGQQGTSVFVVDSAQTVAPRTVKVARTAGDIAVIESGLQAGERVVTDGQLRLVPGAHVEIKTQPVRGPEEAS
ncbi:MAG TPA: efflux RND transporter periplasmic adaptor subunit [Gemmatimonadales bacterium]|nr:efflux RND transporter periplasmic adaptor subunit [Gemmatimonadales bacterium]